MPAPRRKRLRLAIALMTAYGLLLVAGSAIAIRLGAGDDGNARALLGYLVLLGLLAVASALLFAANLCLRALVARGLRRLRRERRARAVTARPDGDA